MLQLTCSSLQDLTFQFDGDCVHMTEDINEHTIKCFSLEKITDNWQVVLYTRASYNYNVYYIEGENTYNLTHQYSNQQTYGFSKSKGIIAIENSYRTQQFTVSLFGFNVNDDEKIATIVSLIEKDSFIVQTSHSSDLQNNYNHYNYLSIVDKGDIVINSLDLDSVTPSFNKYGQTFDKQPFSMQFGKIY